MLSDFLLLETYYDTPQTTRPYEVLVKQYGVKALHAALRANYLICKPCGCHKREKPTLLFWLTENGRRAAQSQIKA